MYVLLTSSAVFASACVRQCEQVAGHFDERYSCLVAARRSHVVVRSRQQRLTNSTTTTSNQAYYYMYMPLKSTSFDRLLHRLYVFHFVSISLCYIRIDKDKTINTAY